MIRFKAEFIKKIKTLALRFDAHFVKLRYTVDENIEVSFRGNFRVKLSQ